MPSHRRHRGRRRTSRFAWEMAFEAQVRQVPDRERAGLLAWLRDWRQRPRRTFLVMDDVGHWYLLT